MSENHIDPTVGIRSRRRLFGVSAMIKQWDRLQVSKMIRLRASRRRPGRRQVETVEPIVRADGIMTGSDFSMMTSAYLQT